MVRLGQERRGRRDGARMLSASVIGLAAFALVGGVAYVQFKHGDESQSNLAIQQENPAPPRNLAQNEAARATAEKRLAEAMAIQVTNLPSATAPQLPVKAIAEKPTPATVLARTETPPAPVPPLQAQSLPTPAGMSLPEQDALMNRVEGLLKQGDIGAARAILNRLVREHNGKAAFVLAQSYDPQVLQQGKVVGLRPDSVLARSLYEQALQNGIGEAKAALDALPPRD